MSDLHEFKERYRRSLEAFTSGDAEPQKPLWSSWEGATLANPLGPPAKGRAQIFEAMDRAAAGIREGGGLTFEVISSHETPDLAYEVALQGGRMRLGDSPDMVAVTLRVTSIFRREEEGWALVQSRGPDHATTPARIAHAVGVTIQPR